MSEIDTTQLDGPELLRHCRDDAQKWAAAFNSQAVKLGYSEMDEGWLIAWFANAIENSHDIRTNRGPMCGDHAEYLALRAEKAERELVEFRDANRSMHESYLRIRELVPQSFKTPYAPSAETIHGITEAAVKDMVDRLARAKEALRRIEADSLSHKDAQNISIEALAELEPSHD